jgi:TatD DNase family protein
LGEEVLIDAHAHLDKYGPQDEDGLESAEITQHKIFTISNSMDLASYERNLEISKRCAWVLPTFGVHPWNASQYTDCLGDLNKAIEQSPMLGEIGLDHFFVKDASAYTAQRKVFECFLSAAREQGKIVNLHTKGAEREVLELLERHKLSRVIVHWYSGPLDVFQELVARRMYFTVGIELLYSKHIRTIAQAIPSRQLLTETDNPGGPKEFIGKLGMPVLLKDVVRGLAEARNTTTEAIVETVQANLAELTRDDPWLTDTQRKISGEWQNGR